MQAAFKGPEISIHALLAESDAIFSQPAFAKNIFLSTLSLRRATIIPIGVGVTAPISIHALLAESDRHYPAELCRTLISIHALLAESDLMWYQCNTVVKISIHALLAESDSQWRTLARGM